MPEDSRYTVDLCEGICKGSDCYICLNTCPKGVFAEGDTITSKGLRPCQVKDPAACVGCMICESLCPELAITITDSREAGAAPSPTSKSQTVSQRSGGWRTATSILSHHPRFGNHAANGQPLAGGRRRVRADGG